MCSLALGGTGRERGGGERGRVREGGEREG